MKTSSTGTARHENDDPRSSDVDGGFVFERFFAGAVTGWGIFEDRFRRIRSRFDIEMAGSWRDDIFVIDEILRLETGDVQERRWRVAVAGGGTYRAQVDDVVGMARGRAIANGVAWAYRIRVPVGGRSLVLAFDDRMYGRGDEVLNVAVAKKWGVAVGRLVANYRRA